MRGCFFLHSTGNELNHCWGGGGIRPFTGTRTKTRLFVSTTLTLELIGDQTFFSLKICLRMHKLTSFHFTLFGENIDPQPTYDWLKRPGVRLPLFRNPSFAHIFSRPPKSVTGRLYNPHHTFEIRGTFLRLTLMLPDFKSEAFMTSKTS